MFVWWGPELINIYNDAYTPVLGKRHPAALGKSARDVWAELWPQLHDDVEGVVKRGIPVLKERVRLVMERNGYPEETFFTYSHSPILDESGGIGGLIQVCSDETVRVLADRERDKLRERQKLADDQARIILESISDAFVSLDREFRFVYVNPQAEKLLSRTSGDLLGVSIWDAYPAIIGTPFENAYRTTMHDRVTSSHTTYYPEHDRWYEVHTYPAYDGRNLRLFSRCERAHAR